MIFEIGGEQKDRGTVLRRFRGEFHQKVDTKGRMSIPASFRRVLEAGDPEWTDGLNPQLVVLYGDHLNDSLHVYTITAFMEIEDDILALPRGSDERRYLSRTILGQSLTTDVDKDGRLVLPKKQRDKIGLEGEVFFTAAGDHFQIWRPETYETVEAGVVPEVLKDKPEDFDPLILLDQARG
jgi:MraZ protein